MTKMSSRRGKFSSIIAAAAAEALGCKLDEISTARMSEREAFWFGMFQAQCRATDEFFTLAKARGPKALRARITELEKQCEKLNARIIQMQSVNDAAMVTRKDVK